MQTHQNFGTLLENFQAAAGAGDTKKSLKKKILSD